MRRLVQQKLGYLHLIESVAQVDTEVAEYLWKIYQKIKLRRLVRSYYEIINPAYSMDRVRFSKYVYVRIYPASLRNTISWDNMPFDAQRLNHINNVIGGGANAN